MPSGIPGLPNRPGSLPARSGPTLLRQPRPMSPLRCGIGWNTMAAVGSVESAHGSHGGNSLNAAGQSSGPIMGPSLDGNGLAAIADTDAGVLDGYARGDHDVGPMQFGPSIWDFIGRSGKGDGIADPFDIDDAALSAAAYLSWGSAAALLVVCQSESYRSRMGCTWEPLCCWHSTAPLQSSTGPDQ